MFSTSRSYKVSRVCKVFGTRFQVEAHTRELFWSGPSAHPLFSTDPLQMFCHTCAGLSQKAAKSLAIIPESPNTELIEAHCFHGLWGSCWVLRIRGFSALGLRFHSALGLKVSFVFSGVGFVGPGPESDWIFCRDTRKSRVHCAIDV